MKTEQLRLADKIRTMIAAGPEGDASEFKSIVLILILTGLLDINLFITTNITTQMCSYINDHSIKQRLFYNVLFIIEKIIVIAHLLLYKKNHVPAVSSVFPQFAKTRIATIIKK